MLHTSSNCLFTYHATYMHQLFVYISCYIHPAIVLVLQLILTFKKICAFDNLLLFYCLHDFCCFRFKQSQSHGSQLFLLSPLIHLIEEINI